MEEYQEGSREAFDALYRRYAPRVMGYIQKRGLAADQAEEVLQQVFIKLHQSRQRFDPKLPFPSWIFTITRHALIDFIRQNKKWRAAEPLADPAAAADLEPETLSLESLDKDERELIEHRYLGDKSYREISALLGISEENARQKASRALRKLRQALKRKPHG